VLRATPHSFQLERGGSTNVVGLMFRCPNRSANAADQCASCPKRIRDTPLTGGVSATAIGGRTESVCKKGSKFALPVRIVSGQRMILIRGWHATFLMGTRSIHGRSRSAIAIFGLSVLFSMTAGREAKPSSAAVDSFLPFAACRQRCEFVVAFGRRCTRGPPQLRRPLGAQTRDPRSGLSFTRRMLSSIHRDDPSFVSVDP
jgi:hypothetical protein